MHLLPNLIDWLDRPGHLLGSADFAAAAITLAWLCIASALGMLVFVGCAKRRRPDHVWSWADALLAVGVLSTVPATLLGMLLWSHAGSRQPGTDLARTFTFLGACQMLLGLVDFLRKNRNEGTKFVSGALLLLGALPVALLWLPASLGVLSVLFMLMVTCLLGLIIGMIVEELSYRSECKYRTVLEGCNEAIMVVSLWRYNVLESNQSAQRLLRLTASELLGRNFLAICPRLKECSFTNSNPFKFFSAVFRPHHEFDIMRSDGSMVRCAGDAALVEWRGKVAVQVRVWERECEAGLNQMSRRADKMEALGKLVAGVAHELNNPLTVVLGLGQLLTKRLNGADRQDMDKILHESNRAARIVRDLLLFARPSDPQFDTVDLNDIVVTVLDLRESEFQQQQIDVVKHLAPALPLTKADARQIEQVLINLINNAVDAMAGQSQRRKLTVTTQINSQFARISVNDTGPGIPEPIVNKIFDPFFTTKPPGKGTGLGLSISGTMIEEHRGRLWADSRLGKGATFHIELPIVPCKAIKPKLASLPQAGKLAARHGQRRLLVVDDEPGICEVLQRTLEEVGCTVDIAANGVEAMRKIDTQRYELILSDINMPELNGETLYATIAARDAALAQRIIFITGDTLNEATCDFLNRLPNQRIHKPFTLATIEAVIGSSLHPTHVAIPTAPAFSTPSPPPAKGAPPIPVPMRPATNPATQRRVLVVDDEPGIREVLQIAFVNEGYAVDTAINGVEGLQRLSTAQYDAVLSDLNMPEMDGQQFYETVCARHPGVAERFIFTTGDAVSTKYRQFLDDVSNPRVIKPFSVQKLLQMVKDVMELNTVAA